jgi:diaminopimelate epimerase
MRLELVMADPAGNRTALVRTPVPGAAYAPLAQRLMALPELGAEQVGYCLPPSPGSAALGRLEMMGGEFCGNAARSFALLLARESGPGRRRVPVEVSGCPRLLLAEADPEKGWAASPMPLPLAVEELEVPGLGRFPAVLLEGITHVMAVGVEPSEENFRRFRRAADARWTWEALGVMFFAGDGSMAPAVAVRATGSVVFESSCASGSTAAAVWSSRELRDGVRSFSFPQPGGVIAGEVEKKEGRVLRVTVEGPVSLEPPRWVELPDMP